jgi:hypothetical protein
VSSFQICTTRFAVAVHEDRIELGAVDIAVAVAVPDVHDQVADAEIDQGDTVLVAAHTGVVDSLGY